eukprot:m.112278 g.112278  ORF g.112278 m.112278 type:complete len:303 (-) comp15406_c0_seq1:70-978(-)
MFLHSIVLLSFQRLSTTVAVAKPGAQHFVACSLATVRTAIATLAVPSTRDGTSSQDQVEEALKHIRVLQSKGLKYVHTGFQVAHPFISPLTCDRYVSYDQHMGWLNFSLHDQPQPVFINLLRDPIEGAISQYYASLHHSPSANQYRASLPPEQRNWSLNQCLEAGRACQAYKLIVNRLNSYSKYFCGYHPDCVRTGVDNVTLSAAGVARTIHNLHNEYLLVGITERYDDTLKLFKRLLPTYFSAVDENKPIPRRNRNPHRPKNEELSPKAKRVLRQGLDHQLYAIALELFETKYRACFCFPD